MNTKHTFNGRVKSVRKHKNCIFMDLDLPKKIIQLCINDCPDSIPLRGDIVNVTGVLGQSKTGQETLFLETFNILNRPEKIDAINYDMRELLLLRHNIESIARNVLESYGAISVCTNVLSTFKGTSNITLFKTSDLKKNEYYLKITHELELKRMITDTQLPVYEIGRVFRDMGQDARHNREYKVLEAQFPYITLEQGNKIVADVIKEIFKKLKCHDFDNIPSFTVREKFYELGCDFDSMDNCERKIVHKTQIKTQNGPFFLTNPPAEWSPLTLLSSDGVTALDSDLVYNGKGISHVCEEKYKFEDIKHGLLNGTYSEQNMDLDFLNHIMAGMPPSTGFAIGLDRIASIFLNAKRIHDVIPYSR